MSFTDELDQLDNGTKLTVQSPKPNKRTSFTDSLDTIGKEAPQKGASSMSKTNEPTKQSTFNMATASNPVSQHYNPTEIINQFTPGVKLTDKPEPKKPSTLSKVASKTGSEINKWVLQPINSLAQAPLTIGEAGAQGYNQGGLVGALKGYGKGIADVLQSKNTVSTGDFVQNRTGKQLPTIAKTALDMVSPADLIPGAQALSLGKLGRVQDIAKASETGIKALSKIKSKLKTGEVLTETEKDAVKKNPDYFVDEYGNAMTDISKKPLLLNSAAKEEPFMQVKYTTQRNPKNDILVKNTVNKVSDAMDNQALNPRAKYDYYRFTDKDTPMSNWGHAMFSNNRDRVEGYGKNEFGLNKNNTIDINQLKNKITKTWNYDRKNGFTGDFGNGLINNDYNNIPGEEIFKSFNPDNIVDSADAYDGDLHQWLWDRILKPNNIDAIRTKDGAIVFNNDKNIIQAKHSYIANKPDEPLYTKEINGNWMTVHHKDGKWKMFKTDTPESDIEEWAGGNLNNKTIPNNNISDATSRDIISNLINAIKNKDKGETVGLRVPTSLADIYSKEYALKHKLPYTEINNHNIGDILNPSYKWKEGYPTNRKLSGTSAIEVNKNNINDAIDLISRYPNSKDVLIIKGQRSKKGFDEGEILLKNAKVINKHNFNEIESAAQIAAAKEISFEPSKLTQQIGKGISSAKTLIPKAKQPTEFNAYPNRELPFKATQQEIQAAKLPLKNEGNINLPSNNTVAKNGAQGITNDIADTKQYIATKTKSNATVGNVVKKTYDSIVDDLYPIKEVNEQSYVKALNSRQVDMIAHRSLTAGLVDQNGKVVGNSLKAITSKIPRGLEKDFEDYVINRRAPYWMEEGKKVFPDDANMTPEKSRIKTAQYESQHPEFKQLGDDYIKYNKDLTKTWLVNSGFIKPQDFDNMVSKDPDYVPFQREFTQLEGGNRGLNAKRGFANQTSPVKKATGSQRKIISPIESTIEKTGQYIKTAKRNDVMNPIVDELEKNPNAYEGLISIVPSKTASLSPDAIIDVNKIIQDEGIDGLVAKFNKPWESQQFIANKGGAVEKGANIVTVMRSGAPVHLKVDDMDLLKAISNLNPQQATTITRAVGKATGMMKTLTTGINPVFGLARNVWKDLVGGYKNSKTINANPLRYAQYMWDLTRAIGNTIAEPLGRNEILPKSFRELFAKGGEPMAYFKNIGGGGHVSSISSDRNLLAKAKSEVMPKSTLKKVAGIPRTLYSGLESLNNTLEAAPRLAEAKRVLKKGGSNDKALYESQDLTTNFSKKGNIAKEADAFIPYLNAAIQGLDKEIRVYNPTGGNAKNAINSIAKSVYAITIPTMILYAVNHNSEAYNQLSDYQKDNYFNIPKPDETFFKIPKPREPGVFFGALIERTLRAFKDHDPEAFTRFSDTIKQNFIPPHEMIWQPAYSIMGSPEGRDWRGNPIINQGELRNSPRYQYNENTSAPAKWIGDKLNVSPKKIDALGKAYLGGVASLGIPATSENGSLGKTLSSQMTADPLYNNDITNDFYKYKAKLDTGAADAKEGFTQDAGNDILKIGFTRSADDISTIRGMINQVQADKSIDAKTKETKLRDYQQQILDIAKKSNVAYKSNRSSISVKYPEISGQYYPESSFTFKKEKIELTPDEYDSYRKEAAGLFKKDFAMLSMNKNYPGTTDQQKEVTYSLIDKAIARSNKKAQENILKNRGLIGTSSPASIVQDTSSKPDYGKGNIDLNDRPIIKNSDGSISTVYSMTFVPGDLPGLKDYLLLPGVREGLNRKMTPDEALEWYQKTGEYLGRFKSEAEADKYAESLHEDQAKQYVK